MHLSKSKVEYWFRCYQRFFLACCWSCPLAALVFVAGYALIPRSYGASRVLLWLFVLSGTALFLIAGGYFALMGLSLFYRRYDRTLAGAICGLSAGLLFGAFSTALGIGALFAMK